MQLHALSKVDMGIIGLFSTSRTSRRARERMR
jgi:hypothetical protein